MTRPVLLVPTLCLAALVVWGAVSPPATTTLAPPLVAGAAAVGSTGAGR